MKIDKPRVCIGLPVYNGEDFLVEALEALLAQTYDKFELIISDNASTDKTSDICQLYVTKDQRVHYRRNETNIGALLNFRRVFELSSCEYFKWAAHDDLHAPEFVERCVDMMDQDPSIVLCYTKTKLIDEVGKLINNFDIEADTASTKPHERLFNMLNVDHWCFQEFGLIRADILRKVRIIGDYYGWDRTLLAELCLYGRVYEIPEYLFSRRIHSKSSTSLYYGKQKEKFSTYDPGIEWNLRFLGLRRFWEYASSISRAPLNQSERLSCYLQLVRLAMKKSINRLNLNRKDS